MVGPVRIKDHQREQRIFYQRALLAAVVMAAMTLLLVGRLVLLQVVRYDQYKVLAEVNRARIEHIPANRGLIFDRNGHVLAENRPSYQLELVREDVRDLDATIRGLVQIGVIAEEQVDDVRRDVLARRPFESVAIQRRLTDEQIAAFAVHRHQFPGVQIHSRSTRHYPHGSLAVHALGYVGTISEADLKRIDEDAYRGTMVIGKRGVEAARESELHGVNGFREILVNALGRSVQDATDLKIALREKKPEAGADLILALDLPTQQAAEAAFAGRRGAAVAIDPNNGDVLAFVSLPGFDPSLFGRGITTREYRALETDIDRPLFNRAIMGTYPPGSTVKPVLAMAGLAYDKIEPHDHKFCPGHFQVPNSRRRAREGRGGVHGWVDMRTAISKSCDVYFYSLALELGVDAIHEFLSPFGFGRRTGIDIAGEVSGILPSQEWKRERFKEAWYPGDTVNFGIGQGFMTVTPMQLAQVTAVLAAQGRVFRPRLVTGIRDPKSGEVKTIEPVELPHVPGGTPEQWKVIMEGMRETMRTGTARAIATSAEYTMAGKTGTAQVFSVAQNQSVSAVVENERLRDHSWFIAFAPAENPKIAVAVLVENGGFGASAAAPIARQIFDAYLLPRLGAAAGSGPAGTPPGRGASR
ncbi:MAG: penicillin-binding protein 2 [Pseudomonadota bacterium]|jgi:penicillin-binding protein 2|nr:MAG: penicillin-binding protein 2 [Pseudomonadota bacterium]